MKLLFLLLFTFLFCGILNAHQCVVSSSCDTILTEIRSKHKTIYRTNYSNCNHKSFSKEISHQRNVKKGIIIEHQREVSITWDINGKKRSKTKERAKTTVRHGNGEMTEYGKSVTWTFRENGKRVLKRNVFKGGRRTE